MPEQDAIMTRMIAENPRSRPGKSAIGPKEGIIFSDIRLHMGHVLRSKNPHLFRPDLFIDGSELTGEIIAALSSSHCLVKARYISEEPLQNDRHLHFMAHLADSTASVGGGVCIYDVTSEQLFTPDKFGELLESDPNASRSELHAQVVWKKQELSGHAETKGLIKKGLPELSTEEAHLDVRVLVVEVMQEALKIIWNEGEIPTKLAVEAYGDHFTLDITSTKKGPYRVRVLRMRG